MSTLFRPLALCFALLLGTGSCGTGTGGHVDGDSDRDDALVEVDSAVVGVCSRADDCPAVGQCLLSVCTPTGQCDSVPLPDGTACDDGNVCTVGEQCLDGLCRPVSEQTLCDDGDPCSIDSCDPTTGACSHVPGSGPCNDGNACTDSDLCLDGECVGTPLSCADESPCTTDSCDPESGCLHLPLDGIPCDDGDPCTTGDLCQGGACGGTPVGCTPPACHAASCDPETGACTNQPLADGTPCDDQSACTTGDACLDGSCVGEPVSCDDGNACTADACDGAIGCLHQGLAAPCDDGNPCTQKDGCQAGFCVPGAPVDCSDGNPCTKDLCDPADGTCTHQAVSWPCDDGNGCTTGDVCLDGVCEGTPISCDDGNPCTADSCGVEVGCLHFPVAAPCDDGNPCTLGDLCDNGGCQPGPTVLSCDDGNPCTDDGCNPADGSCLHLPNALPCNDGNPCTAGDTCGNGVCQAGSESVCACQEDSDCLPFEDGNLCNGILACNKDVWPTVCAVVPGSVVECSKSFDSACRVSVCQPESGLCMLTDLPEGTPCSDGDFCTLGDGCVAGECVGAGDLDCDDSNPCTENWCDPEKGCQVAGNALPCDDGNLCTLGDLCGGGNCNGLPVQCDDGNPCTIGACQPDTGECQYALSFGSCDDGNPCTENDVCSDGFCQGAPRDCSDDNPCTEDGCHPDYGCTHLPLLGECDDGNACTIGDTCQGIVCKGTPVQCEDDNPCTDDLCDADAGCLHPPNLAPCQDGDACTYGDHCDGGLCTGYPVNCEDGNPCTDNWCHSVAGCLVSHLDVPCSDVNPCTVGDWCSEGTCIPGPPLVCDDGNECTLDYCDPDTGECVFAATGWPCDDGNNCTGPDLCKDGVCNGFPVQCEDGNPCTTDSCVPDLGCQHTPLDGLPCDDGNLCTLDSECSQGECVAAGLLECDDGDPCTADLCLAGIGCATEPLTGPACDDGDPATLADSCLQGTCLGLPDADGDGVPESGFPEPCQAGDTTACLDNCPEVANSEQDDGDGDGIGDVCEWCGPVQPLDGLTPPDPALWHSEVEQACPTLNHAFAPGGPPEAGYLALTAVREADCDAGLVRCRLWNLRNLRGSRTTVAWDLGLAGAVFPAAFLGQHIAELFVTDGNQRISLVVLEPEIETLDCGLSAVVPTITKRADWHFEFDGLDQVVFFSLNGQQVAGSPADLSDLGEAWYLGAEILGGDYLGGCGATCGLVTYGFDSLCDW